MAHSDADSGRAIVEGWFEGELLTKAVHFDVDVLLLDGRGSKVSRGRTPPHDPGDNQPLGPATSASPAAGGDRRNIHRYLGLVGQRFESWRRLLADSRLSWTLGLRQAVVVHGRRQRQRVRES